MASGEHSEVGGQGGDEELHAEWRKGVDCSEEGVPGKVEGGWVIGGIVGKVVPKPRGVGGLEEIGG